MFLCDVIDRQPIESTATGSSSLFSSPSFVDDEASEESEEEIIPEDDEEDDDEEEEEASLIESDSEKSTKTGTTTTTRTANKKHGRWRYYVHYRDFNRRLDEWITMDRIVSPPSVGAAKAKAIAAERKREEELFRKKSEEQRNRAEAALAESAAASATGEGETAVRITRRQKRKSEGAEGDLASALSAAGTGIPTITPGADVVATVPAEELDEHAGLDESALREHEEVTKVRRMQNNGCCIQSFLLPP